MEEFGHGDAKVVHDNQGHHSKLIMIQVFNELRATKEISKKESLGQNRTSWCFFLSLYFTMPYYDQQVITITMWKYIGLIS